MITASQLITALGNVSPSSSVIVTVETENPDVVNLVAISGDQTPDFIASLPKRPHNNP